MSTRKETIEMLALLLPKALAEFEGHFRTVGKWKDPLPPGAKRPQHRSVRGYEAPTGEPYVTVLVVQSAPTPDLVSAWFKFATGKVRDYAHKHKKHPTILYWRALPEISYDRGLWKIVGRLAVT